MKIIGIGDNVCDKYEHLKNVDELWAASIKFEKGLDAFNENIIEKARLFVV